MNYQELELFAAERRKFDEITLQRVQYDDSERLQFVRLHQPWKQGASYGTNEYVRYESNGKLGLYRSSRNISNSQSAPDVSVNPQQWAFVGWAV